VVRLEPRGSHGLGTHPVPREPHPLEAALQNWGKNAEKNNSTISASKKSGCGWNDLSEFEAFSTDVPWCPLEALPRDVPKLRRVAA
jgi:hypothetical protein